MSTLTCLDHAKVWGDKALNFFSGQHSFWGWCPGSSELEPSSQACRMAGLVMRKRKKAWLRSSSRLWRRPCKNIWKTAGTTGRSQRTPPSDMMLEIHLKIPDPSISQLLYFILKEKMYWYSGCQSPGELVKNTDCLFILQRPWFW